MYARAAHFLNYLKFIASFSLYDDVYMNGCGAVVVVVINARTHLYIKVHLYMINTRCARARINLSEFTIYIRIRTHR